MLWRALDGWGFVRWHVLFPEGQYCSIHPKALTYHGYLGAMGPNSLAMAATWSRLVLDLSAKRWSHGIFSLEADDVWPPPSSLILLWWSPGWCPAAMLALHLIEEMSLALDLHINLAKCELFSREGNTSFPPHMWSSLLPNLDILGVPIEDYSHCSKFIAGMCAESRKLLLGLVDVTVSISK